MGLHSSLTTRCSDHSLVKSVTTPAEDAGHDLHPFRVTGSIAQPVSALSFPPCCRLRIERAPKSSGAIATLGANGLDVRGSFG